MEYGVEFVRRVFGNVLLDMTGVAIVLVGALTPVSALVSAWAVTGVLVLSSFLAFRTVAQERDTLADSDGSSVEELAQLLATARVRVEAFSNELEGAIALADYDGRLEPIEMWWSDLLDQVSALSPLTAAQLGSKADIDKARRRPEATTGNMNLSPLRSFLENAQRRLTDALNTLR